MKEAKAFKNKSQFLFEQNTKVAIANFIIASHANISKRQKNNKTILARVIIM